MAWLLDPARWIAAWRDTEWSTWAALALTAIPYAVGVARLWRRAGTGRGIAPWRAAAFAAGVLVLAFAPASPLDALADGLLAAHMTQHLLLVAVVPPLLVAGSPLTAWAWLGTPRGLQHAMHALSPAATLLVTPVVAFSVHTAALWVWHMPGPFQLALRWSAVHAAEHATLLLTGCLVWWSAMRPRSNRRSGLGVGILLLLATAMQSGALGALFATARTTWYAIGSDQAAAFGLTPLADQQFGGLVMWIPGGIIYTVAACALFVAWFDAPRHRHAFGVDAVAS